MTFCRLTVAVVALLLGGAAIFLLLKREGAGSGKTMPSTRAGSPPPPPPAPGSALVFASDKPAPKADVPVEGPSHLADELNAPAGTIRRDLEIVNELFVAFHTNFPRTGNPVGENAEITAALAGANPVRFAFVAKSHPAINARGELCDRWGTPFRFHQLSGTQMEIRSAGPDRKFGTADDAEFSPTSVVPVPR